MLEINISINGRTVATATARNTDGGEFSSYDVRLWEDASKVSGLPELLTKTEISGHKRAQSVWSLVEKIAVAARYKRHLQDFSRTSEDAP